MPRLPEQTSHGAKDMDGVEIVNYHPRWPALFDEEAERPSGGSPDLRTAQETTCAEHPDDREAYTEAKSAYVESVVRKAMK